ncbi:G-type lectin S-receptor-like serine/threonine-protein kinase RLK1 [Eucalyptus grandis]|uniref:G-type lectin S-receptor-like serine/threonine-protein kinase RLK1 n=1 Tax=Eucalyptus grandis TaxID=71139 RepID=UPI00192EEDAC|nr:G-type lectin S-receptor-like serine/threonine-protein kinase RLK1 [Eucalyptus grandis]
METRIPLIIIESVLLSSSVFVNLLLLLITYLIYRRFRSRDSKLSRLVQINQATGMQTFTYQELQEATDEFKEELGRGAFGTVYKGVLGSEDTNFVVVKVLATRTGERENEFEREVSAIGQTNHKHLVQLLGFCNEGQHRLLVYEFMSNDTLADFLFGISKPTCFGILLVELICCRKNYEPGAEIEAQIVLVDWVYDCYLDGNVLSLVESDEEASNDMRRVRRFVMTTLWCIQEDLALRLAMKKITQMLEGAVEVPVPPFSSSFISSI